MNNFDSYQMTAEKLKDEILEKNRQLTRQLAEKDQSFELVKMVHFNKEINLQTLNDIIIGCTGALYATMFSNKLTVSNLGDTHPIYHKLIAQRERFMKAEDLILDHELVDGFTTIVYPVGISDMVEGHHHRVRCIVMLYPNRVMDQEVISFIKSFMIVNEVLINIVLTRERMTELIETDPLTKAFNRLAWRENMKRYNHGHAPFYILLVDLDNFKAINDTYGHPKGDEVLKFTVAWLKSIVRADDKVFRLGGDEFAVTGIIDPLEENTLTEKIKIMNESFSKHIMQFLGLQTTLSLGALFTKSGLSEETIFSKVDDLLYRSKASGKNTITVQNDLDQGGEHEVKGSD